MPRPKTYKVSEETKKRLVTAAGELFAEHNPASVSVRDITRRAGTKINSISYHFGGKDGLLEAVWKRAFESWETNKITDYLKENETLLAQKQGQRKVVTDIIDIIYSNFYSEEKPLWINIFLSKNAVLSEGYNEHEKSVLKDIVEGLSGLFRRITGSNDEDELRCWCLTVLSPGAVLSSSMQKESVFVPDKLIDSAFYNKVKNCVTKNALFALKLL